MNVQSAVQQQLGFWHGTLGQVLSDCSEDALNKSVPGAKINSIASIYAHTVIAEDVIVHAMMQGKPALAQAQGWEAKTGITFPGVPPMMTDEWARALKMNLAPFQEYAAAVFAASDAYVAGLSDAEMERKVQGPAGETTVGWFVVNILATHVPQHTGEIAALKGIYGAKGLPF